MVNREQFARSEQSSEKSVEGKRCVEEVNGESVGSSRWYIVNRWPGGSEVVRSEGVDGSRR